MGSNSKYEDFKANEGLKSFVTKDPFIVMKNLFGDRYLRYRQQWVETSCLENCPLEFPLHIDLDLMDACNQRCAICHQYSRQRTNNIMSKDLLQSIIDEGSEKGLCALNVGASAEPLLQKDLLVWGLKYAVQKGIMDIFLHTNGVLLDDEFSMRLVDSGLRHLCVSIDASTEVTYQKIRRSKDFNLVVNNVLNLIKLREKTQQSFPTVRVSFCANPINREEIEDFKLFWSNRADLVEIQGYKDVNSEIEVSESCRTPQSTCSYPFRRIMIWPDGDITLCCAYRSLDVFLGNIVKESKTISEIWQGERLNQLRDAFKNRRSLPGTCVVCLNSGFNYDN